MNKRILNLLLAMVLIVGVLPFAASAYPMMPPHVHSYKAVPGQTYKQCACGATCGKDSNHVFGMPSVTAASCTNDGEQIQTCTICQYQKKTTIPAGHNWVDGYNGTRYCTVCFAGCGNPGYPTFKAHDWSNRDGICKNCGKTCVTHDWTNKDGACKTCGKPCGTHDWTNKDGTCKTCGKPCGTHDWTNKDGACKTCGKPCGTHDWTNKDGACKTCGKLCGTHDWTNEDGACKTCGKPCGEHTWNHEGATSKCTVCGLSCAHTNKTRKYSTPATCLGNGITGGYECNDCGDVVSGRQVIPALGHKFDKLLFYKDGREPTCVTKGRGKYQCVNPGCTETEYHDAAALGHDNETYAGDAATCTSVGHNFKLCKRCETVTTERIDALGHEEVILRAAEPTCTATGMTEGKQCSRCEEILIAQEVLPMKDHDMSVVIPAADATCTEDGHNEYKKCSGCDKTEGYQVIKAAHKFDGYKCTECDVYNCDHKGADIKYTESTCTDPGSKSFFCPTCKYEYMIPELPLVDHEYENKCVAPTCTSTGLDSYVCKGCGHDKGTGVIPKLEHNYVNGQCTLCSGNSCTHTNTSITERVLPNCKRSGYETVTCDNCHKVISTTVLNATPHQYGDDGFCTGCGAGNPNRLTFDYQDIYFVN